MAGSDIAMNDFQIVNDLSYVYGEKSDGSQVKILKSKLVNVMSFYIDAGEEIDTGINHAGIVSVLSLTLTGSAAIIVTKMNSASFTTISLQPPYSLTDETDRMCIYKKDLAGNLIIKNNTNIRTSVRISLF